MSNPPLNIDTFLKYYVQRKQRIDLNIDMDSQKVIGLTKMTFILDNETSEEIPEIIFLYLNAENVYINSIKIQIYENIQNNKKININNNKNIKDLEFKNTSPFRYYKNYLDELYGNIEELESFKNINRVEWEIRQKGNIVIKIPKKLIFEKNFSNKNENDISRNVNISKSKNNKNSLVENSTLNRNDSNDIRSHKLIKKIKIIINYELIEKNIGIIFQQFNASKADSFYKICYTPNFYFNTQCWVPCIYDLNLQIHWSLYLYIPHDYMSYSSCFLNEIIKDKEGKKLIISKTKEPTTARNIGFIVVNDKKYKKYFDQNNKNFIILGHENKKEKIENNLINNKLIGTLYNYYYEFFDINENNLNSITIIIFIPYLLFNCPYQGFNKFLKLKEENYLNFIKFPYLYILPDKFIYNESVPEISRFQLRNISKIFLTNYIGGLIIEKSYADFWIINGFESWISNLFLKKVFKNNYIKSKLYKWILKLKKICKKGKEILPLYTNHFSHPIDIQLNPIFDLKSKIILHLLESQIETIFVQNALKSIINERNKKGYNISTVDLIIIFNKNCGIDLKQFLDLYVYKTGMFEISFNYIYNHKTNSIDIDIHQEQIAKKYYDNNPFFKIKDVNYDYLNKIGKNIQVIDYRIKPNKNFNLLFNLDIIQTNFIKIMKDVQQINLVSTYDNYSQNFPLITNNRKLKLKQREKDFIQELIINTGINKIYSNDEIEQIFKQNPILWIRVDSELSSLSIYKINQQHILYEYIKIFKEDDCIGQMESLYNIGKDKNNYEKSLQILRIFLTNPNIYYKTKKYGLKIYIKILKKLKKEDEYLFLLDMFDDYYNELLKNKNDLNVEIYYIMLDIIKYLGGYKESDFKQFSSIGLVNNSSIENKIINKFLQILISDDLNTIRGFDNCYFISKILINTSKFNLQEKSIILLEKILKNLRIEKLKRSINEIIIISTLNCLINLLIQNEFFFMKKNIKFNIILKEIFYEVNYYINNETENYELNVFLNYFQMFMIFYKSQSYIEFSDYLIKFVLGDEYNNTSKMAYFSNKKNLDMISKIKALKYLFENNILYFDSLNDKIVFLSSLKTMLYSPISYIRGDCRNILENLYEKFYLKDISEIGAGNNNFNNVNFLHLLNKDWINYSSKKYADEDWLYNFINDGQKSLKSEEEEDDNISINIMQEENTTINEKIKKYIKKYKNDDYYYNNKEISIDKSFNEILIDIIDKLMGHPISKPFRYPMDKETLNGLYNKYINIIINHIDLYTIKNKILNNSYDDFISFNKDISLMFNNCFLFNEKDSLIYIHGIHLYEYYNIIIFPLKKIKNFNKDYKPINHQKNEIKNNNDNEEEKNNNNDVKINTINNNKILNKKRKKKNKKK